METVKLIPKSRHGKNRAREAGNPDRWEVLRRWPSKILVQAPGNPDSLRWVELVGDPDFTVVEDCK